MGGEDEVPSGLGTGGRAEAVDSRMETGNAIERDFPVSIICWYSLHTARPRPKIYQNTYIHYAGAENANFGFPTADLVENFKGA